VRRARSENEQRAWEATRAIKSLDRITTAGTLSGTSETVPRTSRRRQSVEGLGERPLGGRRFGLSGTSHVEAARVRRSDVLTSLVGNERVGRRARHREHVCFVFFVAFFPRHQTVFASVSNEYGPSVINVDLVAIPAADEPTL